MLLKFNVDNKKTPMFVNTSKIVALEQDPFIYGPPHTARTTIHLEGDSELVVLESVDNILRRIEVGDQFPPEI